MWPPARWNAGTPGGRVNIVRNAPETADLPGSVQPAGRSMLGSPHNGGVVTGAAPGAVTELLRAWSDGDEGALEQLVALDRALVALAAVDARKSRVIELRFFGGLSVEEAADVLHVSADTVKRDWRLAKLWLLRELDGDAR